MIFRFTVLFFGVHQTLSCIQEEHAHSNYFHIKQNFRLAGNVIRTTLVHSFLTCAHFCSREPRCVSLNYIESSNMGGEGVCELNSRNAITSALVQDDSYSYATKECNIVNSVSKPEVKSLFFPVASTANYVMLRDIITSPLAALTLCFWMRTNDTTIEGTPLSYSAKANGGSDNEILMTNYKKLLFRLNNGPGQTGINANDGKWHHICTTWENTNGSWAIYKDGQAEEQGTGLKKGYKIKPGGIIVLGQEQDSDGGSFNNMQSFIGEMTNVNIWSRDLTAAEIFQLSSSCAFGSGDVMKWSAAIGQQTAGVKVISTGSCV